MLSGAWMRYCLILWTLDVHLCSRSPQGERGLKYHSRTQFLVHIGSLPARGAWIEMSWLFLSIPDYVVAPRKGSVD